MKANLSSQNHLPPNRINENTNIKYFYYIIIDGNQEGPFTLEQLFEKTATDLNLKKGSLMLPLRIMLVGDKFGPGVFDVAHFIGKDAVVRRLQKVLATL